ncbi:hypothetical protein M407DRAFT_12501 [Tulasnella calospora MUT 4182]|uniref:HSF-type DNA-binding domain-containing protein n=1 Tax=Tulasnella calospora MUT 4182 TaxID=1051891 RepID=A0A0C3L6B8_9AGAM|nr:hypothetical protein M407DRAFT_12501 [Tulasnella calospora MUT 4182]
MFPRDPTFVFTTVSGAPNPSELHTLASPPLPVGYSFWGSSSGELDQDEASYPLQNNSHARQRVMVAEREETALHSAPAPLDHVKLNHPKQRLPSGNEFPFKLYLMLEDETVEPYVKWSRTEHGDAVLIPDTEAFVANVMPKHFKGMTKHKSRIRKPDVPSRQEEPYQT